MALRAVERRHRVFQTASSSGMQIQDASPPEQRSCKTALRGLTPTPIWGSAPWFAPLSIHQNHLRSLKTSGAWAASGGGGGWAAAVSNPAQVLLTSVLRLPAQVSSHLHFNELASFPLRINLWRLRFCFSWWVHYLGF